MMKRKLRSAEAQREISINLYRSVWEVRNDGWIHLSDYVRRLADMAAVGGEVELARQRVAETLDLLEPIESYWAFPGRLGFQRLQSVFQDREHAGSNERVHRISRALSSQSYRRSFVSLQLDEEAAVEEEERRESEVRTDRPYFEGLIVDELSTQEEDALRQRLHGMRRPEDKFIYELVVVPSFEDALIAVLFNFNVQACVIRYGFPLKSEYRLDILRQLLEGIEESGLESLPESERGCLLGTKIAELRPELDLYMVTDVSAEDIAGKLCENFHRVFYREEDDRELHFSILQAIEDRYQTPFFTALREYSKQPTGVFHALPISRGKSILQSHWIRDMIQFYGLGVFLAETSATSGGLDSLLEPIGPIKVAQELAARAFGAKRTFWVTNGTSTANKIVVQALIQPGDIVLLDRNCHKSHHYGMVLSGAQVVYLDAYPLNEYSMYGAVPLKSIKRTLLELRRAGKLDRVKLVLLTNCTFAGIVYDVERVMEECLAIKPDLIFLWDEAWFAFAGFHPTYRLRTGMGAADRLRERFRDPEYRQQYVQFKETFGDPADDESWINTRLVADPDRARIRVYVTHSTHKTLTALRQGSMIHVYDQDFKQKVEEAFHEAYMTHTSTSPNYQILASLDVGRRQVELEGYELVQKQVDHAMALRERIATHALLKKYFRFLTAGDLIRTDYRPSGIEAYFDSEQRWARMEECWHKDEFVVDPTRLTLYIGATGIDGDTFKHDYLMEKYGIQINKTSRNTVLFMTNIGTTRSSVAYLIEILVKIAQELDERNEDMSAPEANLHHLKVESLTKRLPALPAFSQPHPFFRDGAATTPEGDMRKGYFMAYNEELCQYVTLRELTKHVAAGLEMVSAMFVIPYPPGFPILVPGQVISKEILAFIEALDTREIHGYRPELGFRVFTDEALAATADAAQADALRLRV